MVIQWDEPETPNGQVTVGAFFKITFQFFPIFAIIIANEHAIYLSIGIQSILHNGFESTYGVVAVSNGG